ncbi:hypothetical protein JTE90_007454 [Oedothorax gibbosus]|uniref:C3H1-type domain-containing protein n=1 Tax=Oedothorax gibbosus TaxID=931172 RepID=A0AAV6U8V9_9ARAC|nr:hypothetical protein JTE90_007454 [Oedothorax gibbosus]
MKILKKHLTNTAFKAILVTMMSEELDFEADAPVADSSQLLSLAKCSSQVIVKKEPVEDDITGTEVTNHEITSNSVKVKCEPITVESFPKKAEIEAEEKKNGTSKVEVDSGGENMDAVEEKSDTGKIEYAAGGVKIDAVQEKKSDAGEIECDTAVAEIDAEATGEIESDTGEILSDSEELANNDKEDLEDGELDEDITLPNKAPEVVCRFFQRGTCFYGSQCRNSHVSNGVYNMFSRDPPNNGSFKPLLFPNFYRPPLFHPNIMPMMVPETESPWERGIKKAKIIMQKSGRLSEDVELENDWERCLEEAKANIEKASRKRKSSLDEKPYSEQKYSKQDRFQERKALIKEESPEPKYSKNFYPKYENESNYAKKTKTFDEASTHDPFKWVDPWQRSKSPKRRTRSISFSVSPSQSPRHSRERSVSSSSSSSSYFEQIYRGKNEGKSIEKRSTSRSASPLLKTGKDCKSQIHGKKRSYSKSASRSFSRSPKMRRYSRSSSSEHSEGWRGRKKVYSEKRHHEKTFKRVDSRNQQRYASNEKTKVPLSSGIKSSYNKTSRKFSSRSKSRSTSPLSSLSCTSVSSASDTDHLNAISPKTKEEKVKTSSVRSEYKAKETSKMNQAYQEDKRSISGTFRKRSEEYDYFKKKYSPERPKLSIPSFTIKKSKSNMDKNGFSQSALLNPSSKPTLSKKVTVEKPSGETREFSRCHSSAKPNNKANSSDPPEPKSSLPRKDQKASAEEMQLLRYHSFAQSNIHANSLNPVIKPSEPKTGLPLDKSENASKSMAKEETSKSTSDVQPKSQPTESSNTSVKNVKVLSKRKMLLQQLQAIEDAIARKKQTPQ